MSSAPVRGLKEFPHTGGFSIRERSELPSCAPGQSIIPTARRRDHSDRRRTTHRTYDTVAQDEERG